MPLSSFTREVITARQELRESSVFSCMCHSVCPRRGRGPHVIITHDIWTSMYSPPPSGPGPPRHQTLDPLVQCHLPTDIWWPSLDTCSFEGPRSNIWWWPLKHIWFAIGQYASYWNALLLLNKMII